MKNRNALAARPARIRLLGLAFGLAALSAEAGTLTYTNPVVARNYPDPSVIRVGSNYWAVATSGNQEPVFPIMRSTDLVHWKSVGPVFERRPSWTIGSLWAPEISAYRGRYFIYYAGRNRRRILSVAVATANQPGGPYTDHGALVAQKDGSIDPAPFTDTKGNRYLIWKEDGNSQGLPTIIWMQRLDKTGLKLVGRPWEIIRNDAPWEGPVVEGPYMLRRKGWFYLFYSGNSCCGAGCHYALGVARARSLHGPWVKNPANPILAGNAVWKCPGHGSITMDEEGRYWLLYHAYAAGHYERGRQALLDQVKFGSNGWPTVNHGHGPSITNGLPSSLPKEEP